MGFAPDVWLSQATGFSCYRFVETGALPLSTSFIRVAMGELASGSDAFFFAKVPVHAVSTVGRLERAGFSVVDTNVLLARVADSFPTDAASPVAVVDAQDGHHAALQDIAGRCFRYSRFHLDPLFPPLLANAIKRRWVAAYCMKERGDSLYVAMIDGTPVGFMAVMEDVVDTSAALIDLIGVLPERQRHGIGSALVGHFSKHWSVRSKIFHVGTQISNMESLAFYGRCGFHAVGAAYVLHAHYRDGVLLSEDRQV